MTKQPRPHADVIKAWAEDESALVEWRVNDRDYWSVTSSPVWDARHQYRIRPAPKKTVEMWQWLWKSGDGSLHATNGFFANVEDAKSQTGRDIVGCLKYSRIEVTED